MRRVTERASIAKTTGLAWRAMGLGLALVFVVAARTDAQAVRRAADSRIRPEIRLDYLASPDGVQAGAGIAVRMSTYVRLAVTGGLGPNLEDDVERLGWRADLLGRFHLDPFRERRWAPYAAAGVSVRGAGSEAEEYLVALFGLEGPLAGGWSPAIEVGVGGGARAGLVLRRGGMRYR